MIFVGPYLSNSNCHFNTNVVDSIGNNSDLVIDVREDTYYLEKINDYLKDKNIEDEIVIYNPYEKEDFVIRMKKELPNLKIFMYCSDDEWRCFSYDRYLALYVDFFSITAKKHLPLYEKWGFKNVIGTNWACNPNLFYPITVDKKYDVTFIGTAYGKRIEYVREAIKNKVKIKVFGKGWNDYSDIKPYWGGYISSEDMNTIINQSKINLNFMWSSQGEYQVKGRNFELSGCKVFQLCNYGDELLEYFEPKKDIDTFKDKKEFIEKIDYYLKYEDEREDIANQAYKTTMEKHTWDIKFKDIFKFGKDKKQILLNKFNILVLTKNSIKHNVRIDDDRLNIDFTDKGLNYDGIIKLEKDSTINNDTLYLMVFALFTDNSDVVFSNFYIKDKWIRFSSKFNKKFIKYLPQESIMYKNNIITDYTVSKISYIEYPTFKVKNINLFTKVIFNILFSSYNQREKFTEYKSSKNILGLLRIILEYGTRKLIIK